VSLSFAQQLTQTDSYLVDTWVIPSTTNSFTFYTNGSFTAVISGLPASGNYGVDMSKNPMWIDLRVISFGITLPGIYAHNTSSTGYKEFLLAIPTDQAAIFAGTAQRPTTLTAVNTLTFIGSMAPVNSVKASLSGPDKYQAGKSYTLKAKITNTGTSTLTNARVWFEQSSGVSITGISGCKASGSGWSCSVNSLAPGAKHTYKPQVKVTSSGKVTMEVDDSGSMTLAKKTLSISV